MKESSRAGFIFPLKVSHKGEYGEGERRKEYFFMKIMFEICKFMKVLHQCSAESINIANMARSEKNVQYTMSALPSVRWVLFL